MRISHPGDEIISQETFIMEIRDMKERRAHLLEQVSSSTSDVYLSTEHFQYSHFYVYKPLNTVNKGTQWGSALPQTNNDIIYYTNSIVYIRRVKHKKLHKAKWKIYVKDLVWVGPCNMVGEWNKGKVSVFCGGLKASGSVERLSSFVEGSSQDNCLLSQKQ